MQEPHATPHRFTVTQGNRVQEVVGRTDAISVARHMSRAGRRRAHLERADGRLKMRYANGHLEEYVLETRRRN